MPITLDRASALCFLVSGLSSRELKNLEIFLRSASGRESIFLIIASLSIIGILFSESIRDFLFPAIKTCRVSHSSICERSLSRPLKRDSTGLEIPRLVLLGALIVLRAFAASRETVTPGILQHSFSLLLCSFSLDSYSREGAIGAKFRGEKDVSCHMHRRAFPLQ